MQWFSRLGIDINYDYLIEKLCSYEAKEKHAVPYIDSDYYAIVVLQILIKNIFHDRDLGFGESQF